MDRVLKCEACGEKILVSRAQAGQEVKCGSCGASNQVPTLRGMASLPLATNEPAKSVNAAADTWGWRGPVTAICLAGLLISLIYAGRQFYIWYQIDTSYTAELHIEDDSAQLDQAGVDAMLLLWDDYSKVGLGKKRPPIYKQFNDFSARTFRSGIVGSVIFALMSLAALVTIKSAKTGK